MAKGAIQGLTLSLAAELAPKVRVNCIAPSLTNTPLASKLINSEEKLEASRKRNPLLKVGEPKEIAELASFLLTEKSSWITGQVISVDGGMGVIRNN
jgi:NAD(P)-dependent dehydrogenase (short-subunit alcohol dehydrogenase family)